MAKVICHCRLSIRMESHIYGAPNDRQSGSPTSKLSSRATSHSRAIAPSGANFVSSGLEPHPELITCWYTYLRADHAGRHRPQSDESIRGHGCQKGRPG